MCDHTGIIVQARLGSTRLPQKMSRRFYAEDSLLSYLLKRLLKSKYPVYVATSTAEADKEIVAIAEQLGIPSFRGSEQDVLQRFIDAASHFHLDKIIRVCADNPFISIEDLDLLGEMLDAGTEDYVCFKTSQGIPTIKTHYGFWGEGVTLNSLKNVAKWSKEKMDHEHVTIYIYSNPTLSNQREVHSHRNRTEPDSPNNRYNRRLFSSSSHRGGSCNTRGVFYPPFHCAMCLYPSRMAKYDANPNKEKYKVKEYEHLYNRRDWTKP